MDSSNLSVILAPNLLHFGDGTEKMNANTEKRLKLQAAIVHCFIENAHSFGMTWGILLARHLCGSLHCSFLANIFLCLCLSGVLPQFLQEKVPAMMGCEAGVLSPSHDELEELDLNSGMKKRRRRSFGGKTVPPEVYLFDRKMQNLQYAII